MRALVPLEALIGLVTREVGRGAVSVQQDRVMNRVGVGAVADIMVGAVAILTELQLLPRLTIMDIQVAAAHHTVCRPLMAAMSLLFLLQARLADLA